jgi:hypothetical protein
MTEKKRSAACKIVSDLSTLGVPLPPPSPYQASTNKRLPDEQVYAILAGLVVQIATAILEVMRKDGHVPEILFQYFTLMYEYQIILPGMKPFYGTLNTFFVRNSLCMERMRNELDKSCVLKIVKTIKRDELVVPYATSSTHIPDTLYTPYYKVDPWIFARILAGGKIPYRYIWRTFDGLKNKQGEWWQIKEHHLILEDPRFKTWCEEGQRRYVYAYFRMPSMYL